MVSSTARVREVHRYYRPWLTFVLGSQFSSSSEQNHNRTDRALTAFAQLGALRLNVKRGMVTLIDDAYQYILAEATRSLSLGNVKRHAAEDGVVFGNAKLERGQLVSDDALDAPAYTATDSDGTSYTAAALVIDDVRLDDRYKDRPHASNGPVFFAGVPIVSRSGHRIGVYNVTHNQTRARLSTNELIVMVEMATTIFEYLEMIKNRADRDYGDQLICGLESFIEGLSTTKPRHLDCMDALKEQSEHVLPWRTLSTDRIVQALSEKTVVTEEHAEFKGISFTHVGRQIAHVPTMSKVRAQHPPQHPDHRFRGMDHSRPRSKKSPKGKHPDRDTSAQVVSNQRHSSSSDNSERSSVPENSLAYDKKQVFSRAAKILRESTDADGVIFFDASFANVGDGRTAVDVHQANESRYQSEDASTDSNSDSQESTKKGYSVESQMNGGTAPHNADLAHLNKYQDAKVRNLGGYKSDVLGVSVKADGALDGDHLSLQHLSVTDADLKRCIQRYPQGKLFSFTEEGVISSSDEMSQKSSDQNHDVDEKHVEGGGVHRHMKRSKGVSKFMPKQLLQIVPGARNILFLPLWNYNKARWSSGAFIWSMEAERLVRAQDNLSYLKAFGNSIMCEIARHDAMSADTAKTTFIASISHELRSPLHGILGGIEFLQDTSIDSVQQSLMTSVETCGKTLLDTVNHLLDYAKIDDLSKRSSSFGPYHNSKQGVDTNVSGLTADFDLARIVEEAVEAVCAGQTYKTTSKGAVHDLRDRPDFISPVQTPSANDANDARFMLERGPTKMSDKVTILLDVQHRPNWIVTSQAGACRRIVMNLLGNALKYTQEGSVHVHLETRDLKDSPPNELNVCLSIKDTGKGMSKDFLQNHIFSPFVQEDPFSAGTGLGLSIVRQIVSSLGGQIEVQSQQGVGTEAKVLLAFSTPQLETSSVTPSDELLVVAQMSKGLVLCILRPDMPKASEPCPVIESEPAPSPTASMRNTATDWFGMSVIKAPRIHGPKADVFIYAEPPEIEFLLEQHAGEEKATDTPLIVVCTNPFEAAYLQAHCHDKLTKLGQTIEIFSQPFGPQKLAQALKRCFRSTGMVPPKETEKKSSKESHLQCSTNPARSDGPTTTVPPPVSQADNEVQKRVAKSSQNDTKHNDSPQEDKGLALASNYGASNPTASDPNEAPSNRRPLVLVVDDNHINLQLLVAFVEKNKLRHQEACNGFEALEAYKSAERKFDYVLMDVSMPVMDGLASTRAIRQYEKRQGIKPATIIALTGLASASARDEAFESGANFYLTKPAKFKELRKLLSLNESEKG